LDDFLIRAIEGRRRKVIAPHGSTGERLVLIVYQKMTFKLQYKLYVCTLSRGAYKNQKKYSRKILKSQNQFC